MAVGGMGMLSTSNYAARKFGVRAAMPGMGVYWLLFVFSENVFNFVKIYIKRIVNTEDRHDGVKHYV